MMLLVPDTQTANYTFPQTQVFALKEILLKCKGSMQFWIFTGNFEDVQQPLGCDKVDSRNSFTSTL